MKKPLIGVAIALIAASGASAAMAALPGVTAEGPVAPKVKPKSIVYSGDGSLLFAGAHRVNKHNLGSIHWSKWGKKEALGSGANWINDCTPYCAAGTYHGFAVTLKLTEPKKVAGHDVFTRMLVTYTGKLPSHASKTSTWKLVHTSSHHETFFSWHYPPSAV